MTAEILLLLLPALILIVGAAILGLLPERLRSPYFVVVPLVALAALWMNTDSDKLSLVFGTIFAMIASIGGIYAYHLRDRLQQMSAMVYAGGAMGVVLAQDYYTLFVFWELMAVSSTYLIWANRTTESQEAGMRYLAVHILGGGLLFAGIVMLVNDTGSSLITSLPDVYTLPSVLILLGVALNTAIPPLNAWLPDAYPKATITGAVFMSAFTTKSAVFVLMRIFPGWDILIWFGVAMALYGVVYAVLANDIRQILAYHIISQVGYMVAGVGIGTEMALNGTAAHAFSHILYKSLLFMGAGTVLYATGKSKLTELGGIASKMKAAVFLYMIGAFSISGFPLFNGYISKSMIVSAAGQSHLETAMLLLILASVGTFLHTGLKLPYFTWFGESKSDITVGPVPQNMLVAMGIGAFFCTLFGVYPDLLYRFLPYEVTYNPYTVYHLVEMTQILVFTFIGFWTLRKKLEGEALIALDTDWFYRRSAPLARRVFVSAVAGFFDGSERVVKQITKKTISWVGGSGSRHESDMFQILAGVLIVFVLLGTLLVLN
jgi:multicomponent Na+:H+ antiporter subunit D